MHSYISGIQQIGIGVKNAGESMIRYKELFGMDVLIFDDTSDAALMTRYTGGKVFNRRAVLSLNMQGGGGFEIWQFNNRKPAEPAIFPEYGDAGIYAAKIKCANVAAVYEAFKKENLSLSSLSKAPNGELHFWVKDNYGNQFNVVSGNHWFKKGKKYTGGVTGAVIGVRDMDKAITLYRDILGIHEMGYDESGSFNDTPGNSASYRRVLLRKHPNGKGAFNKLLGSVEIELVQCLDREPNKIYDNRYWGDCGFIHLCFDVLNMEGLKKLAASHGFHFTVDSNESFAMENAAGRFCYLEDPDGTLIELVETHKVPVLKKLGWYLDLKKRNLEKPLPDWMIGLLALSKVK